MARPVLAQAAASVEQRMVQVQGPQALWDKITDAYEQAQRSGAAAKYKTHTQILRDPRTNIAFVLRVAESLRDKPKPPKRR